ncbi:MAG: knotted carbamoyltransferase YgeW [Myxococcota bacterium]
MSPTTRLQDALPALDHAVLQSLLGQSLLCTQDWSDAQIDQLLAVARAFETLDRAGVKADLLPNELAWALFFDNSTRTKSAWAGAATRLGMQPVIVDGSSTQIAHGETSAETGAMLGMNSHAMGVRHDLILGQGRALMREMKQGIDEYLAATDQPRKVPLVNLQCDLDHPTQTLADLQWLRERLGGLQAPGQPGSARPSDALRGKRIAMSWAYSPSYAKPLSVPQGIIMLLTRSGADVVLAHPEGYELLPEALEAARANAARSGGRFSVTGSMDEAFAGADAVYPKSWGPLALMHARVDAAADKKALGEIEQKALAVNATHKDWICDARRMALTRGGKALYLHCLPADIGAEVTPDVMEGARIDVAREAQKKVYAIMALLAVAKVEGLAARLQSLAGGRA